MMKRIDQRDSRAARATRNAMALLLALGAFALPSRAADETVRGVTRVLYPPYHNPPVGFIGQGPSEQIFILAVEPGASIVAGGIAVDKVGNTYVSDYGFTPNTGRVIMLPRDGRPPLTIVRGLDRPSDLEISPDGRTLLIAGPNGNLYGRYFGVAVRVSFSMEPRNPVVFLITDTGPLVATRIEPDGYYHFPNVLAPTQQLPLVEVVVVNNGIPYKRPAQVLQVDADGVLTGQTILDISI